MSVWSLTGIPKLMLTNSVIGIQSLSWCLSWHPKACTSCQCWSEVVLGRWKLRCLCCTALTRAGLSEAAQTEATQCWCIATGQLTKHKDLLQLCWPSDKLRALSLSFTDIASNRQHYLQPFTSTTRLCRIEAYRTVSWISPRGISVPL